MKIDGLKFARHKIFRIRWLQNDTQFHMEIAFFSLSGLTSKLQKFLRFDSCLSEVYPRASVRLWTEKKKKKSRIFLFSFSSNRPKGLESSELVQLHPGSWWIGENRLAWTLSCHSAWMAGGGHLKRPTKEQKQLKMAKFFSSKTSALNRICQWFPVTLKELLASPISSSGISLCCL